MMNSKKSSVKSTWKYLLFLPVAIFTITLFNPTSLDGLDSLLIKPQKFFLIITANTTLDDLTRLQAEVRKYNYVLSVNDVSWEEDKTLKSISAELNQGLILDKMKTTARSSKMKISIKYNDINKHNTASLFFGEKNSGSSIGGCSDVESIKAKLQDLDESEKDFIVLASFLDQPMTLENFSKSNLFEINSALFNNESQWSVDYWKDTQTETDENIYYLDQEISDAKTIQETLPLRELVDVKVTQKENGILSYQFITLPLIKFKMTGSSVISSDDREHMLENASNVLDDYKSENNLEQVNYYLDGILSEFTLETIEPNLVKNVSIEYGDNFDINGEHLGKEIRVLFKSI